MEFSDDEQEAEYKKNLKQAKRKKQMPLDPDEAMSLVPRKKPNFTRPPRQEQRARSDPYHQLQNRLREQYGGNPQSQQGYAYGTQNAPSPYQYGSYGAIHPSSSTSTYNYSQSPYYSEYSEPHNASYNNYDPSSANAYEAQRQAMLQQHYYMAQQQQQHTQAYPYYPPYQNEADYPGSHNNQLSPPSNPTQGQNNGSYYGQYQGYYPQHPYYRK